MPWLIAGLFVVGMMGTIRRNSRVPDKCRYCGEFIPSPNHMMKHVLRGDNVKKAKDTKAS